MKKRATAQSFLELMDRGRIDVVQVDLTRCGGFTEAMKIAALAWDRGLPVANHGFTTYVNVTAALHWLNSIPNALICEFVAEEETNLREAITRQKLRARTATWTFRRSRASESTSMTTPFSASVWDRRAARKDARTA